jgi:hypothetical protein
VNTESLRKCGLALILAVLTSGVGKGIAQSVPKPPPSQPSPDGGGGNPGGGNPNPNCTLGQPCLAIH